jgi:hypothetical protein
MVKRAEEGWWSNDNRFALEKTTMAWSPNPVEYMRLPQRYPA